MSSGAISFAGSEAPSIDELAGGSPAKVNLLTDAAGALRQRPGLSAWDWFPSVIPESYPVVAIGSWKGWILYVTQNPARSFRRAWAIGSPGAVAALTADTESSSLAIRDQQIPGTQRPIILGTRARAMICGGGGTTGPTLGSIRLWAGSGTLNTTGLTPGFTGPGTVTHIASIANRIVANDERPSGIIYWSDIGDTGEVTWQTGLNFREAETKKDPVTGLYENYNELVAIGPETIQMLSPDPSETFTNARTMEIGSLSPYSYTPFDEEFRFIDSRRRYMVSNGRSFQVESTPWVGHELENMAAVDDAWGYRYKFGNYDLGVTTFPTDGRTMVYDTTGKAWSEWRAYDPASGGLGALSVTSAYFLADDNTMLVGLSNGRIAKLDPNATTDLGNPIVCQVTSSFINRGTTKAKKCDGVRLTFKRGALAAGSTGYLLLSYRDDLGPFCEPFRIDLGDPNDVQPTVSIRSLGTYRTRQWRLTVDSALFRFASMEEDFGILDS